MARSSAVPRKMRCTASHSESKIAHMEYVEISDNDWPDCYGPEWEKLSSSNTESPFMEASFYLLREAMHWTAIISGLRPSSPFDRNRAIVRGLIVRLTKLMRLTVRELSSGEAFQQLSISRDIIETIATLLYLLGDEGAGERFDQYVMNSLVAERKLLQDIQRNIKRRDGEVLPIEERMKRSIAKTAKAADIDDVSKLPARSKIGFPTAEARVRLLGPNAYASYRMGSVETHGDWNDLFRNHLSYDGKEFSPNLDSLHIRPQVPLMLVILSMTVITEKIGDIINDEAGAKFILPQLKDLLHRAQRVNELHEHFLQQ